MDVSLPCIKIQVQTRYIKEQSNPEYQRFVFAYLITIKNLSSQTVQLMSRRWLITDADGKQTVVEGDGVVGEQPRIKANDECTALDTPVGVMQGQYLMIDEQGESFTVEIEPFRLAVPHVLN
ncbi:Co2+/Mg2+ efflux protein ApaG [Vibrio cholerae]|uniref:Co2+/Mg2+ efflux protein ApaG n=1 Tax=Vibrio cholerae TaxID=666 RepID=UPI003966B42F